MTRLDLYKGGEKFLWTKHSKRKIREYQLSERRLKRVLRHPGRTEEGIAPGTIAAMQTTGTKKHPTEIWLMYQILNPKSQKARRIRIISAWRYPGVSPVGEPIPIPDDILEELKGIINRQ